MTAELAKENESKLACDEFFDSMNENFDQIEAVIANDIEGSPNPGWPLKHLFTPGLYVRSIVLPAGSITTSKIHLTEHPFVIASGHAVVWGTHNGTENVQAPYLGVTKPGTRRIIFAVTDVFWLTFHATEEKDVEVIEKQIIMNRINPLIKQNALSTSRTKTDTPPEQV